MSDYTPVNDFTAKDALTPGDANKLIKGSDVDAEFDAIQTATNSKYDSADLASQAQAEALTSNAVLLTPLRLSNVLDGLTITAGGGLTGTDTVDNSPTLAVGAGTGILVNANDVALDTSSTRNADHALITMTAGNGLTGGGTIGANRTFDVAAGTLGGILVNANDIDIDINSLTSSTIASTDPLMYYDVSLGDNRKATAKEIVDTVVTVTQSTFTPTWTGFSTAPTGDMTYVKQDFGTYSIVTIQAKNTADMTGTSNSASMTITNIPSALRPPSGDQTRGLSSAVNNSSTVRGGYSVTSAGVMSFSNGGTTFTGSGTKGLRRGETLSYMFSNS